MSFLFETVLNIMWGINWDKLINNDDDLPLTVWLYIPGGHALRAGPAQSLSPLVSPSEGELAAPLSPSSGPTLDSLGPPSSASATSSAPPPLKDNPSLSEFVPILTQGWAEIFIRRPSGTQNTHSAKWISVAVWSMMTTEFHFYFSNNNQHQTTAVEHFL